MPSDDRIICDWFMCVVSDRFSVLPVNLLLPKHTWESKSGGSQKEPRIIIGLIMAYSTKDSFW